MLLGPCPIFFLPSHDPSHHRVTPWKLRAAQLLCSHLAAVECEHKATAGDGCACRRRRAIDGCDCAGRRHDRRQPGVNNCLIRRAAWCKTT